MNDQPELDPSFAQWLTTWGLSDPPASIAPVEPVAPEPPQPMAAVQPGLSIPAPSAEQALESLPMPDTVSGVDALPLPAPDVAPTEEGVASEEPPPVEAPQYFDPLSPGSWNQPISAPDLVQWSRHDPAAVAQHATAMSDQSAAVAREKQAALDAENARRSEQEFSDLREATSKADRLSEEVLNTKIDPRGRRGTGQRIADAVAVFVSGFIGAKYGMPNQALKVLDGEIDRDIEAQKANLLNKRNAIAELRQRGMSDFQAQQAYRVAWYGHAVDQLKTEMQNYDPRGTAALRMAQQTVELEARARMAAEAARKSAFEDELKVRKELREDEKNARDWLKSSDDHLAAQRRLAGGGTGPTRPPEYFGALGLPVPPWAMSDKEHAAWMAHQKTAKDLAPVDPNSPKARKEIADATEAEAKADASKTGYQIKNPETGLPFLKKDGSPLVEMSETKRQRVNEVVTAAANMRRLVDKITELRKAHGGSVKALGSKESQEIQSLVSQVDFETFKAFGLGAPSAGDQKLGEGARGGVDITSFVRDASPGFLAYADGLEKKAQAELRSSGWDSDKPLKFHRASDLAAPKPKLTDELVARAMQTEYGGAKKDNPEDLVKAATNLGSMGNLSTPAQAVDRQFESDVNGLAAQAQFAPDEQDKRAARAALEKLAKEHVTAAGKRYAAQALKSLPGIAPPRER